MTILYPAPRRVKRTRNFGSGLVRSLPIYKAPYTTADEAWLIQQPSAEDRRFDSMAAEAEAMERIESGFRL